MVLSAPSGKLEKLQFALALCFCSIANMNTYRKVTDFQTFFNRQPIIRRAGGMYISHIPGFFAAAAEPVRKHTITGSLHSCRPG
jgi:hypothetical protein